MDSLDQITYYLKRTMEDQTDLIREMQKDIQAIRVDLEVFKAKDGKARLRDATTGGGLGAALMALMAGAYEWFKQTN